jgi:urease accessory protein
MIVEKVIPAPSSLGSRRLERVVLTSGDLARHRQRVKTDAGRDVGISLPHGVALKDGDLLHLDAECAIVVEQAEEDLLWLQPQTPEQFGLMGYQVGNLHRAAMIDLTGSPCCTTRPSKPWPTGSASPPCAPRGNSAPRRIRALALMVPALWRLLQTTDSLFPTGAFSHSGGLEGLTGEGILKTAEDGERRSRRCSDVPSPGSIFPPAGSPTGRRSRETSRPRGSGRPRRQPEVAAGSAGGQPVPRPPAPPRRPVARGVPAVVEEDRTRGHQAVVTGMHAALEGIAREEAMLAFAYGTAAGWVSSAMKLLPLGQTRGPGVPVPLGGVDGGNRPRSGRPRSGRSRRLLPLLDIAS